MLVAIEGGDGSGKTSLRKYLFQTLRAMGLDTLAIPPNSWLVPRWTETIVKAKYRDQAVPSSEITRAYVGDKEALTTEIINPHYPHRHVVVDRYILSDIVYHQLLYEIDARHTYKMYEASDVRWPDLTILVRTDVEIAQERKVHRNSGGWHRWDELERQRTIIHLYEELVANRALSLLHPIVILDNGGSRAKTLASVHSEVLPLLVPPQTHDLPGSE